MPPKPKITKDKILTSVLDMTREDGFESVNARSIAARLNCSTRPIFTCYENMDALKEDFLDFAFTFYTQYADDYRLRAGQSIDLALPLSYIEFAREETNLFRFLFISHMDLKMTQPTDFYHEPGNLQKAQAFAKAVGIDLPQAKKIFLDLFLYSHGLAVLTAEQKLSLDKETSEAMVLNLLTALLKQVKLMV